MQFEEVFVFEEMGVIENDNGDDLFIDGHIHDGLLDSAEKDIFSIKGLPGE